jgi:hypothetical protein
MVSGQRRDSGLQLSPRVSTRSIRRALDEATYLSIPVEKGLSTLNAAGIYREFALAEQFRHARTPAGTANYQRTAVTITWPGH